MNDKPTLLLVGFSLGLSLVFKVDDSADGLSCYRQGKYLMKILLHRLMMRRIGGRCSQLLCGALLGPAVVMASSSSMGQLSPSPNSTSSSQDFTVGQPLNIYFVLTCNLGPDSYNLGDEGEPGDDSSEYFVYNPVSSGVTDEFSYVIPRNVTPGQYQITITGQSTGGACAGTGISLPGTVRIHPAVEGTTPMWWFGGVTGVSGYPDSVTFSTPSGTPPFRWSISGPIKFTAYPGQSSIQTNSNSVQVTSTGWSSQQKNAVVTVQTNDPPGLTGSASFSVLTPYKNVPYTSQYPGGADDEPYGSSTCVQPNIAAGLRQTAGGSDSPDQESVPGLAPGIVNPDYVSGNCYYGYNSYIHYQIYDQFNNLLPQQNINLNEYFSSAPTADTKNNWPAGTATPAYVAPQDWADDVGSIAYLGGGTTPFPQHPLQPLGTVKIYHFTGEWRVGSSQSGQGQRIQKNTWQLYQDHGRHTLITSPAP